MTLDALNALEAIAAEREFLACCGARRWARMMAEERPFVDFDTLAGDADRIWLSLDPGDWLEAFASHPRIGEQGAVEGSADDGNGAGRATVWSAREQAGMEEATSDVRQRLVAVNREYERRFGFIYLVCAQGKSADTLLAIAERRLTNSRDEEIVNAAEEQRKITQLRLAKLVS